MDKNEINLKLKIKPSDIKKSSQIMGYSLEQLAEILGIPRQYLFLINKKTKANKDKNFLNIDSQLEAITIILQNYIREKGTLKERSFFDIIMTEQMFNVKKSSFNDPRFKAAFKHCLKHYNNYNKNTQSESK